MGSIYCSVRLFWLRRGASIALSDCFGLADEILKKKIEFLTSLALKTPVFGTFSLCRPWGSLY
jgi:hypothetical protein